MEHSALAGCCCSRTTQPATARPLSPSSESPAPHERSSSISVLFSFREKMHCTLLSPLIFSSKDPNVKAGSETGVWVAIRALGQLLAGALTGWNSSTCPRGGSMFLRQLFPDPLRRYSQVDAAPARSVGTRCWSPRGSRNQEQSGACPAASPVPLTLDCLTVPTQDH